MKHLILIFGFFCLLVNAQQIHIEYTYVKSPVATIKEDLYINQNKVISIQDSVLRKVSYPTTGWNISVSASSSSSKIIDKISFLSEITDKKTRKFLFDSPTYSIRKGITYLVEDEVPMMNWIVDEKSHKKIAGYDCVKATANFRGSDIVAYFTKDLPYSAGPFKFYGLPGVILDVKVEGRADMRWRAEKVNINDTTPINFTPEFPHLTKITMKEFVKINDESISSFRNDMRSNLPIGVKVSKASTERLQIEKKFEWE